MLDTFKDYSIREAPILNETTPTWKEVVPYLPRMTATWSQSHGWLLNMKAIISNWQLSSQWRAWNKASTQLLTFGTTSRSLDKDILDYQLNLWSDWSWGGEPMPDVDGGTHFDGSREQSRYDPAKVGTYFTVWAARLLCYDILWMADAGQDVIAREIQACRSIVLRAGYICKQHYGGRLI